MTNMSVSNPSLQLQSEFVLTAVMAAELECYVMLADESAASMDALWVPVEAAFRAENLPILRIEKERGLHQYEVITQVTTPVRLVETLHATAEKGEDECDCGRKQCLCSALHAILGKINR